MKELFLSEQNNNFQDLTQNQYDFRTRVHDKLTYFFDASHEHDGLLCRTFSKGRRKRTK